MPGLSPPFAQRPFSDDDEVGRVAQCDLCDRVGFDDLQEVMYRAGQMFRSLQLAFDESFVDHDFRSDIGEFASLPRFDLLSHRVKVRCIRSTPTETQSISENDFECLASTGVKSPLNAMFEHTNTR
jgi:hypothetical protein